jgi:hypothetical protein
VHAAEGLHGVTAGEDEPGEDEPGEDGGSADAGAFLAFGGRGVAAAGGVGALVTP